MLTDQQVADVRRYVGYPMLGDTVADNSRDFAYGWVSPGTWQTLYHRLISLRPEEETIVVNYLTTIATLEVAVTDSSDNLDTDQAAVWYHNKNEVNDRMKLYNLWRRQLCAFIGLAPGPSLGQGGTRLVRG
ncbi:hypothetical protein [Rahnella sikkimica]|uniref:Uncharacterized protein n=1 Tax=Rahnella sikkimica TaxID=1805933 RepID=A0A2L1UMX0_9GAMM|nr:hypothetical protein [Rahnella sikkimica]AVF34283.1 hypothetical protein BV494_04770 [Rahnella sikkimica]